VQATVTSILNFGAFVEFDVDLGAEVVAVQGMIHRSELSWNRLESPLELLKVAVTETNRPYWSYLAANRAFGADLAAMRRILMTTLIALGNLQ
jgi:S1 RNA binding domain